MIVLGIDVLKSRKISTRLPTNSSRVVLGHTVYRMFFLCGDAQIIIGFTIRNDCKILVLDDLLAVAVNAMTLTEGGISARNSPIRL